MDVVENIIENGTNSVESLDEETNTDGDSTQISEGDENWYYMPDSILLSIFQYLTPRELVTAGEVCRSWNKVSQDEFLWRDLFYQTYKIDSDIGIMPGRLCYIYLFNNISIEVTFIRILSYTIKKIRRLQYISPDKFIYNCKYTLF